MSRTPVTVKLDDGLVDDLETEADEEGKNRSEYIRTLLRQRHGAQEVVDQLSQQASSEDEIRESVREEMEQQYRQRIRELELEVRHVEGALDDQLDTIYTKAEEAARKRYRAEKEELRKEKESLEDQVEEWKEIAEKGEIMASIVRDDDAFDTVRVEDQKTYTNEHIHEEMQQISQRVNDLDGTQRRIEANLKKIFNRLQPIDVRIKQRIAGLFSRGD